MNFLIKSLLRKIFTQYLYIEDEGFDLTSGIIKLPHGNINQTRINAKLQPLGIRIAASSYKNLIIHVPLVELASKPIRISIELLDVVVERLYNDDPSRTKEPQSEEGEGQGDQEGEGRGKGGEVEEKGGAGGYLRNIINRLLYNMEVSMERINVRLIDEREEEEYREAYFTLQSFQLKNSLVLLEANIIKKTLTLHELHLRHSAGELLLSDLSLAVHFANNQLHLIALGQAITVNLFRLPFKLLLRAIAKPTPPKKNSPTPLREITLFLKLTSLRVNLGLVEVEVGRLEIKGQAAREEREVSVKLEEARCSGGGERSRSLFKLGYLPFSRLIRINSELEDSAIKQCFATFRQEGGASKVRLYHLGVSVDVEEWKKLADRLAEKERYIERLRTILAKLQQQPPQPRTEESGAADVLIYRAEIAVHYASLKAQIFGSGVLSVSPEKVGVRLEQLGVRFCNYNIVEVCDLQARLARRELIINCTSATSHISLACLTQVKAQLALLQRDVAYYQTKIKQVAPLSPSLLQPTASQPTLPFEKVFVKVDEVVVCIGQLIRSNAEESEDFVSVINLQLSKCLFSLLNRQVRVSTGAIAFITSPYTLHRTPLTNELQFELVLETGNQQLSVSFKNKIVFLLHDQYINIIYKLLDQRDVWCFITNHTHQQMQVIQSSPQKISFQPANAQQAFYQTNVQPFSKSHIFWIREGSFRVAFGSRVSQLMEVKANLEGSQNDDLRYSVSRELYFLLDKDYDYTLNLIYNKLGNLCEISVDYKMLISSFCKDYLFKIGNSSSLVKKSEGKKWQWFAHLQDIAQDYNHYEVVCGERILRLEPLMAYDHCNMMGIYQPSAGKLYESYIYQAKVGNQIKYTIMPFLIITNNSLEHLELEITDKKGQEKETMLLKSKERIEVGHNGKFDYYMKQFIIKISILSKQSVGFESQPLYFNTFFMVDHKTETNVQLRCTQKNNYSKKSLVFQETLLLKTKIITLRSSLQVANFTDFTLSIRVKTLIQGDQLNIHPHSTSEWTSRLKDDTVLQFTLNGQTQSGVQMKFGQLKTMKVLSFNFLKIDDRFFNILVRVERRNFEGVEQMILDHFVQIINLCSYSGMVRLEHFGELEEGVRTNLPLNSTSLNKYNNRMVDLDDITRIYGEIFLTAKVTDLPIRISIGEQAVKLQDLLKESSQEMVILKNKLIVTLLKDMNNNKITFYITDRLFNHKLHYTIFANQTKECFLLADDVEYAPHFDHKQNDQNCSSPEKVFIGSHSFNCFINRQNYDLLLCDQLQTHLQKIDKKVLEKQSIKLQQYNFDSITLFECQNEQGVSVRKQLTTKEIEVRVRMSEKVQLSLSLQALTLRLLQSGKCDCLIQDICIRNEETKDHLLRIPEQTYLLIEGKLLHEGYFTLMKNVFVKCKNIIVNIRRQMPYSLIELIKNLTDRLGLHLQQPEIELDSRKYRQSIKKLNGETKLRNHIKQALLLIRNIYIHEIHLSLTIELENLSFSNVIILPYYEVLNKFERLKAFTDSLSNFYLTTLLAKFPKLSFLMTNFKSPLNTMRLFFNLREALRKRIDSTPLISFDHLEWPNNPFHFSTQRWNIIHSKVTNQTGIQVADKKEKIIGFLFQSGKWFILTTMRVHLWQQEWRSWGLRDLQRVRINRSRGRSELILKFKEDEICLFQEDKRCMRMLSKIENILL